MGQTQVLRMRNLALHDPLNPGELAVNQKKKKMLKGEGREGKQVTTEKFKT